MKTTKEYPLISVVIPTHNRHHLLPQALDSVLNQTYQAVDIVVVDDASTYETQKLLTSYCQRYHNIRVLRNDVAQGPCHSRNMGIYAARGELISFLDDDDEWLPQRLEILANSFKLDYAYICSDYWIKNAKGYSHHCLPKIITYNDMLFRNRTGNTVITKTALVRTVGGFDERLESRQDYDLWLRLLENSINKQAQVVSKPLHIINKVNEDRISVSSKAYRGNRKFFLKHSKKMNSWQKRYQRVNLLKLKGQKLNWKDRVCNWIIRKKLNYNCK